MELLQDDLVFSNRKDVRAVKWRCKLLLINFKKVLSSSSSDGGETLCEVRINIGS